VTGPTKPAAANLPSLTFLTREGIALPGTRGDVAVEFAWEGHPLPALPVEADALAEMARRRLDQAEDPEDPEFIEPLLDDDAALG